jgi:transcriptional regulator with XRE-family HTH domain
MTTLRAKAAFASWCQGFRSHLGHTQTEFAEILDVHRTTITRYETAVLYPSRDMRIRLNGMAREAGFKPIPPPR